MDHEPRRAVELVGDDERVVGEPGGEVAEEPGHPVHTDDRTHRGVDEAAAVTRQHDVRRQGGDEGLDVAAEPGGEEALGHERGVGPVGGRPAVGTVTW